MDGAAGGTDGPRHARAGAGEQPLQQTVEAEVLPGAAGDVNLAEAARPRPGDRLGENFNRGDGTAG
jgi:tripartite-type tricarboxylate transporter receptor subunit TctC